MIKQTPFAIFLNIQDIPQIRGLLVNIFQNWDSASQSFKFSSVAVAFTRRDVSFLLGIPDKGASVPIKSTIASGDLFLSQFSKKEPTRSRLEYLLKSFSSRVELDEDVLVFCKLYILYIFACVLFSTSTYKVPIGLVDIVDDIHNIGTFNWVEAIHQFMAPQLPIIGDLCSSTNTITSTSRIPYLKGFAGLLAVSSSLLN